MSEEQRPRLRDLFRPRPISTDRTVTTEADEAVPMGLRITAGMGVDFDALAQGVDLEGLAGGLGADGLAGAAEGLVGSAGESVSGLGETVSGWGEQLGDLGIPGIGDLFRN